MKSVVVGLVFGSNDFGSSIRDWTIVFDLALAVGFIVEDLFTESGESTSVGDRVEIDIGNE